MSYRSIVIIWAALVLSACTSISSGFQDGYSASKGVTGDQYIRLAEGESATIRTADNLEAALEKLRAEGYMVIGYSQFSGPAEGDEGVQALARENGATMVLRSFISEGRKVKYKKQFERDEGSVMVPVKASANGGPDSEPVTSEGYATEEWFRQTALFLARKR